MDIVGTAVEYAVEDSYLDQVSPADGGYPTAAEIEKCFGGTIPIRDGKPVFDAPVSLSVIEAVTALHVAAIGRQGVDEDPDRR